jgi:NADPH:quinone reductase-like Zn-dependent oxidoreductase
MRAIIVTEYGGPEVLAISELPIRFPPRMRS